MVRAASRSSRGVDAGGLQAVADDLVGQQPGRRLARPDGRQQRVAALAGPGQGQGQRPLDRLGGGGQGGEHGRVRRGVADGAQGGGGGRPQRGRGGRVGQRPDERPDGPGRVEGGRRLGRRRPHGRVGRRGRQQREHGSRQLGQRQRPGQVDGRLDPLAQVGPGRRDRDDRRLQPPERQPRVRPAVVGVDGLEVHLSAGVGGQVPRHRLGDVVPRRRGLGQHGPAARRPAAAARDGPEPDDVLDRVLGRRLAVVPGEPERERRRGGERLAPQRAGQGLAFWQAAEEGDRLAVGAGATLGCPRVGRRCRPVDRVGRPRQGGLGRPRLGRQHRARHGRPPLAHGGRHRPAAGGQAVAGRLEQVQLEVDVRRRTARRRRRRCARPPARRPPAGRRAGGSARSARAGNFRVAAAPAANAPASGDCTPRAASRTTSLSAADRPPRFTAANAPGAANWSRSAMRSAWARWVSFGSAADLATSSGRTAEASGWRASASAAARRTWASASASPAAAAARSASAHAPRSDRTRCAWTRTSAAASARAADSTAGVNRFVRSSTQSAWTRSGASPAARAARSSSGAEAGSALSASRFVASSRTAMFGSPRRATSPAASSAVRSGRPGETAAGSSLVARVSNP